MKLIILIGILGVLGVFIEEIVKEMVFYVDCLVIMLMFNLIYFVEVVFEDLFKWIDGKVFIVIGSLFDNVEYNGVFYEIG